MDQIWVFIENIRFESSILIKHQYCIGTFFAISNFNDTHCPLAYSIPLNLLFPNPVICILNSNLICMLWLLKIQNQMIQIINQKSDNIDLIMEMHWYLIWRLYNDSMKKYNNEIFNQTGNLDFGDTKRTTPSIIKYEQVRSLT